ncbi:23S rRNA pseudouridine(2604) synthase RluF [Lutibacter sp. A80]|uniref:23S rRNA pseudouridine(2604) synthase RluF n=1 Tax=Lutibacter sp. A80 TaxID=2918453 RepID=UPI001F05BDC7|nr:23S rRNA pseudouridine(2604) synthase RluF [Lutibacter sp. A80]UMB60541.1 23S rRNA pseudouridine(2604) synthase RluF [Lutibacter sp. A80]
MDNINKNSINLNKYISSTGICSRREAEKLIIDGKVTINGKPTQLGNRVFNGDIVKINGQPLKSKPKTLYIAYNKPVGIVCTTDSKERNNIVRAINHTERLFPIGRLDKPSQGLIFLTNDGDIVNKILRAGNNHQKEYIVTVNSPITSDFIQKMSNGIPILGTVTKKCAVEQLSKNSFKIILTQGLNRQIRRMCEYLDYKVTKLVRTRIMNVTLANLAEGSWRELTSEEMQQINKMVATSSKTEEASKNPTKKKNKSQNKRKFIPKNNPRFKPKSKKRRS